MGIAYTVAGKVSSGNERINLVQFTTDNTYTAGGYAITTTDIETFIGPNARTTSSISSFISETNLNGYRLALDKTNSKIVVFAAGAQATTTTSTQVVTVRVGHGLVNFK